MFCLDTNIIIGALTERAPHIVERIAVELDAGTRLGIPAVVLFELRYGLAKSNRRERSEAFLRAFIGTRMEVLPFTEEDANEAGEIRAELESRGTPIGPYDFLIAAQTRRLDAVLVTFNTREFQRVPRLMITDWSA
jgi:tRNA(fMet)-specific endonuclease VapC